MRTIPSIAFRLPSGPAIDRDIAWSADSACPTRLSPLARHLFRAIDTDLPQSLPDTWLKQVSSEFLLRVRQWAEWTSASVVNNGADYKQETIRFHRAKLNRKGEKRMTKTEVSENGTVTSNLESCRIPFVIRVSCFFRQSRFVPAHFFHHSFLQLSVAYHQASKPRILDL